MYANKRIVCGYVFVVKELVMLLSMRILLLVYCYCCVDYYINRGNKALVALDLI